MRAVLGLSAFVGVLAVIAFAVWFAACWFLALWWRQIERMPKTEADLADSEDR